MTAGHYLSPAQLPAVKSSHRFARTYHVFCDKGSGSRAALATEHTPLLTARDGLVWSQPSASRLTAF